MGAHRLQYQFPRSQQEQTFVAFPHRAQLKIRIAMPAAIA